MSNTKTTQYKLSDLFGNSCSVECHPSYEDPKHDPSDMVNGLIENSYAMGLIIPKSSSFLISTFSRLLKKIQ